MIIEGGREARGVMFVDIRGEAEDLVIVSR